VSRPARAAFILDEFQRLAIEHLDAKRSVLVTAPTGSGKTVVAEHAIDMSLAAGRRAFYTTPIKALSNQKYRDLCERLGESRVGLLTGDNVINGDADVVVMTTEVLRNMLYADNSGGGLASCLGVVVLDEVHYLEDPYRGPVWEEVILLLPANVVMVCLSATVSNHEQLGGWINQVRGSTVVVSESRRPVPLNNLYAVGRRRSSAVRIMPTLIDGKPNPQGKRFDAPPVPANRRSYRRGPSGSRRGSAHGAQSRASGGARHGSGGGYGSQHRRSSQGWLWRPPRRVDLLKELKHRQLLPVIWFVFSRKGCDQAASRLVRDGACFSDAAEAARIDEIVTDRIGGLESSDLAALGAQRWREQLRLGIATHHAGMAPVFKETVERCFGEGLVKVVFATETLALGVNMPARGVVIDKPVKFNGHSTVALSAAQYTQFTGRAGRRGIDDEGWAVAVWSPECSFGEVAERAASRAFELRSAFRPTYNMVAALLSRSSAEEARDLMSRSFAQFQADHPDSRLKSPKGSANKIDLSRRFDAVAGVLHDRGHLDDWKLTDSGRLVSRIFHEADLVIAEALSGGLLDGLSPLELASVISAFGYEHRSPKAPPAAWVPSSVAYRRLRSINDCVADLHRTERGFGLDLIRSPDPGFASVAHRWAAGESFEALQDEGFSAGDFVRNIKQVINLARQISVVAPNRETSAAAAAAVKALNRGVVALSSTL